MTTGAWVLLAEMAKYDSVVYGDPKGRGPFCIVPGPGLRVDPDAVSPDLPKAEFCTELISAGLSQQTGRGITQTRNAVTKSPTRGTRILRKENSNENVDTGVTWRWIRYCSDRYQFSN